MTHSVLDVAHPAVGGALAAVLLGGPPSARTIIMGLVAGFAGYTSVFALNDVIDVKVDREKMAKYRFDHATFDLDSMGQRHPLAQDSLSYGAGIAWVSFWGLLSLVLAFLLRPACAALLLGAFILEAAYCKLLRVTHWKGLLSGLMVGVGGLAGVWAVTPAPGLAMVIVFFAWAFAWEIGGRNIPNDWSDLEEDRHLGIKTVPVRYGRKNASWISFGFVSAIVILSLLFPLVVRCRTPCSTWPAPRPAASCCSSCRSRAGSAARRPTRRCGFSTWPASTRWPSSAGWPSRY